MKIYIDVRCLQDVNYKNRGVGNHTLGVIKYARENLSKEDSLIALVDNYTYPLLEEKYCRLFDKVVNSFALASRDADIFINAFPFLPKQNKLLSILNNENIYSCCLFYDLIPIFFPDKYLTDPNSSVEFKKNLFLCSLYKTFLSISNSSLNELKQFINYSKENAYVTGASISDDYLGNKYKAYNKDLPFKEKKYFIMVGGGDDRKNMDFALNAFGKFRKNKKLYELGFVLIGKYSQAQLDRFRKIAKEYSYEDKLRIYSNISNTQLGSFYHSALANICPSIAEGFSLPIVESLACNCLPFISPCEAQKEVLNNDQELIFSINNTDDLESLMFKAYNDENFVKRKIFEHKDLSIKYSEKNVSRRVWEAVKISYENNNKYLPTKINIIKKSKPKLAFVTPYPFDKSGCADYSYTTIKAILNKVDVDVYTNANHCKTDLEVMNIRKVSITPYISKKYDAVISVIGNSFYHSEIYDYAINHSSYVIEHDNRLLDFISWKYGIAKAAEIASFELGINVTTDDIHDWLVGNNHFETLFMNDLYDSSIKLFLHSRNLIENFEKINGRKAVYLPFSKFTDYKVDNSNMLLKKLKKKELGVPENEISIVTFGAVVTSKLYEECVKSLSFLPKIPGKYYKLYFIGECGKSEFDTISEISTNLGVKVMKRLYYYFSKEEYANYLQIADIGIQLRRHKLGGISGGLMECICAGIPTVSNKDLATALESPQIVYQIPDDPSPQDIANGISNRFTFQHDSLTSSEIKEYNKSRSFEHYGNLLLKEINIL